MKKPVCVLLGISLLTSCSGGQPQVDKVIENGVEVVLNHVKPYQVPKELSELRLKKEFGIDAENPDLLKAGLTDIYRFGVDETLCSMPRGLPRGRMHAVPRGL